MSKSRLLVASALALVGVLAGGVAHANHGADVRWSVTVGTPVGVPVHAHPAPVYAYPAPVYTQPVPVYTRPAPVYTHPSPVYTQPAPVYTQPYPSYRGGDGHHRPYRHHRYYREPTHWDHDGDGIPNRRDRLYNPRWDVDGDGIPNRHDRDRDGDGIPNWHDHPDHGYWRR